MGVVFSPPLTLAILSLPVSSHFSWSWALSAKRLFLSKNFVALFLTLWPQAPYWGLWLFYPLEKAVLTHVFF